MKASGRVAAAACAVQLSSKLASINHHQNFKSANLLRKQFHKLQHRIYVHYKALQESELPSPIEDSLPIEENVRHWLRVAAAFLAAACLHLGTSQAADALDLASASEDRLLAIVRSIETQLDSTWSAVKSTAAPSPTDSPEAESARKAAVDLIQEVYDVVDQNFSDARGVGFDHDRWKALADSILSNPPTNASAAHSAVRRMVSQLKDPYSRFITSEEFQSMIKYDVSGVGLNLGSLEELRAKTGLEPTYFSSANTTTRAAAEEAGKNINDSNADGVFVVGLIRGSAADSAGMKQGDQILEADGESLSEKTPFAVASLLQSSDNDENSQSGNPTTKNSSVVQLRVRHLDGNTDLLALKRPEKIQTPSPVAYRYDNGAKVGYIRLTSFNARAQKDVSSAVKELQTKGSERIILDVRGNRGGLVSEGVEIAKLFLEGDKVIVKTQGSKSRATGPLTAPGPALTAMPLAVMVDDHTASASEILAGALQDNCRGILVGKRTYGKGLIQSVYELGDGSGLVLTVGKYVTPSGRDIDLEGIVPDFRAMPSAAVADEAIAACKLKLN